MLNERKTLQEVPVDLRLFRVSLASFLQNIKDRGAYSGEAADLEWVEDVYEVWLADANVFTYICSLTPVVEAAYISTEVIVKDDCPDKTRDELWEFFAFHAPDQDFVYFNTRVLDKSSLVETTVTEVADALEECDGDHEKARAYLLEQAVEHFRCNSPGI
jgi:hypothetical protein